MSNIYEVKERRIAKCQKKSLAEKAYISHSDDEAVKMAMAEGYI